MAANTKPPSPLVGEEHFGVEQKEEDFVITKEVETIVTHEQNLHYDNPDEEPEIHLRTYVAVFSTIFLNFTMNVALAGPPAAETFIVRSFPSSVGSVWITASLTFVQAVIGPLLSRGSDIFQARKYILVGCLATSMIGAGIAPGAQTIGRLIAGRVLVGVGVSSMSVSFAVGSEIMPRRWRPLVQSAVNLSQASGAITGSLVICGLIRADPVDGWRHYFWVEFALWGVGLAGILFGYRPPKRHTRYDNLSFQHKLLTLDLPGMGLLTAGITPTLVGLTLGGTLYPWKSAGALAPLVVGCFFLVLFGLYEWKGTKTGILNHGLFKGGKDQGRTFIILCFTLFAEGIFFFAFLIFFPTQSATFFTTDPLFVAVRGMSFYVAAMIATFLFAYISSRFRTIREPLLGGFILATSGIGALASIRPDDGLRQLVFGAMTGCGFGSLFLLIAGVQLSTQHGLIATASAVATSVRAIGSTVGSAIFVAIFTNRLGTNIPKYVASAALGAGLPATSLPEFIPAIASHNATALEGIPDATADVINAATAALENAYADSMRINFIISAAIGIATCIAVLFISDLRKTMTYQVDAPVEELHAKHQHHRGAGEE